MSRAKSVKFQARLSDDNDHERKAMEVLEYLERVGKTRREILTDALLCLGNLPVPQHKDVLAERLHESIQELETLIKSVERGGAVIQAAPNEVNKSVKINPAMVNALQARRMKG